MTQTHKNITIYNGTLYIHYICASLPLENNIETYVLPPAREERARGVPVA